MPDKEKIAEVLAAAKKDRVGFIDLQFTDFFGRIKSSTIPVYKLEDALKNGIWFDGSSIEGFARIHESDMLLKPDPETYALLPWRNDAEKNRVARLICDVYKPNHEPFEGDPRFILKKVIKEAKNLGFDYFVAPECEFFLFPKDADKNILRRSKGVGHYYDLIMDDTYAIKREIIETLDKIGIRTETMTHEVADNQHEIDFHYDQALKTADNTVTLKMATKFIAGKHDYHATYMPKPLTGISGNGMHIHQSLWQTPGNLNAFYKKEDKYGLSATAYQFLAGQLKFAREIIGILAPTVNSYKRLTPGYEAPVNICWARINRSALIRIPQVPKEKCEQATRLEIRCADPSGNPYLSFAVLLKAGLAGIKRKLTPPEPVEENLYKFDDQKLAERYITNLPANLEEALREMKSGIIVKETFGEEILKRYLEIKREEWDSFRTAVTDWEVDHYLTTV